MAIAITEDFVTKSGLIVQGTSTVTSSTGQTNALQAYSGAAIAKNLIVGTTVDVGSTLSVQSTATIGAALTIGTDATVNRDLSVARNTRLFVVTATGIVSITTSTAATTASTGALVVTGGIYSNNLVVGGTTANTGTSVNNALYIAGGVGIGKSLVVDGKAVFKDDVIFIGSSTYVYSVNSLYTDNLLEIHVPPSSTTWTVDDNKDIGLRFHYYSGSDKNAALILSSDSRFLEWFDTGTENGSGDFVSGTYGTFKTGAIKLVGGTASSSTSTGDLTVTGGVGIGQNLNVRTTVTSPLFIGNLTGIATTATNIQGGASGQLVYQSTAGSTTFISVGTDGYILKLNNGLPIWAPLTTVIVDNANTATNLAYGTDTQIPYQNGTGKTTFSSNLVYDYGNSRLRTINATFTGTTNASSTNSGALQIVGGVGIGQNIYIGGNSNVIGNSAITGDLSVNGGDIITSASTFNLINNTATIVNIAGSGTAITVGSFNGYTNIRTQVTVTNTTIATSTSTGALTVIGGVGIAGDLHIGGTTTVYSNVLPSGSGISLGSADFPFADLHLSGNSLYLGNLTISSDGPSLVLTSTGDPANFSSPFITATTSTDASSTNTGALQVVGGAGIGKNLWVGGNETLLGDLEIRGGDLTTDQSTFNLLNANATTVNFAGAGTTITIGSNSGYTNIRNATTLTNATGATSTTTGALQVLGGVGIGENLWVGGNETLLGDLEIRGGDLTTDQSTFNLLNANATTVNFAGAGTAIIVGASSGYTNIRNATTLTNSTIATSTSTGALRVVGGVGIGGALYVGTSSYINNSLILTRENIGAFGVTKVMAGTDIAITTSTGDVTVSTTSTLQTVSDRGNSTTNVILFTNNVVAFSTNSGAVQVVGGVGIGKNLVVGTTATILGTAVSTSTNTGALIVTGGVGIGGDMYIRGTIYGVVNTATNLRLGTVGQIPFQTNTGTTGFFGPGTAGQILVSVGNTSTGHLFADTSSFVIGYSTSTIGGAAGSILYQSAINKTAFISIGSNNTFLRSNGSVASFVTTGSMVVGQAALATNIIGGVSGSILYQNGADSTTSLPIGLSGHILQSDGSNPTWVPFPGGVTVANASNVAINNDTTNDVINYVTFVNASSGLTGIRTAGPSGITYNPSSGNFGIGIATATSKLEVAGNVKISGIITATNTTAASSTNTGALQVVGGVGIGKTLYVGGNANFASDITTNQTTFNLLTTNVSTLNIGPATGNTVVKNNLTVVGNLTIQGSTTIVDSTVTNITDPIITLGGLANNQPLTSNDNKDKGIAFKYFSGSAKIGFFGYVQGTGYFTVIPDATINNEVATGTRGALDVDLAGGQQYSLVYQTAPNQTGFLAPGTAGYILQSNGVSSAPSWLSTSSLSSGLATTATNLGAGTVGQMPFQSAVGKTSFINAGSTGSILISQGSLLTGPVFTTTSSIRVAYSNTSTDVSGGNIGQILYQDGPNSTAFVGTGTSGQLLVSAGITSTGPVFTNTSSIAVGYAAKILGGASGQLLFQSTSGNTLFVGTGTSGQILVSAGTTSTGPVFTNTSSFWVGYSVNANNILGGGVGSVLYQSAVDTTAMLAASTSGYILQTNGAGVAPSWISPTTLSASSALLSSNIANGTAGQIPYQTGPNATSFISIGTVGTVLVSYGTSAPRYQNTLTLAGNIPSESTDTGALIVGGGVGIGGDLYVGSNVILTGIGTLRGNVTGVVTTATNLSAGSTGTIVYQTAVGRTGYVAAGTSGQLLVSAGTISSGPVFTNTSTIGVGFANNLSGGSTGTLAYQSATGTTAMLAATTAGYLLQTNGAGVAPSWVSGSTISAGSATTATNIANGTAGQIPYQSAAGQTSFIGTGTIGTVLVSYGTSAPRYQNTLTLAGTTVSTSTITGALTVAGGVGIGGDMYVGGNVSVSGAGTFQGNLTGVSTTATNLSTGSTGTLVYQITAGVTGYVAAGTSGQLLVSAGTISSGPVFTSTSTIRVGYSATATNIAGGSTGTIIYQSATGTTALLAASTAGYLLQTNGAGVAPSWASLDALAVGNATQVKTVADASLAVYYPTFVNANNASATAMSIYTSSTFTINPGTKEISVSGTGRFTSPANTSTGAVVLRQDAANTSGAYLQWTNNNSTSQTGYIQVTTASSMIFGTTGTDKMMIDASGNVSIGTTSSLYKLNVNGTVRITNGTNPYVSLNNGTITSYIQINSGALDLSAGGSNPITFSINGTERMRITANSGIAFGGSTNYGSSGQVLVSAGDAAPVWTVPSGLNAGSATTATNISNGTAGQIPYQTGPNATSFISIGTVGTVLVSYGTSAPRYQNTLTLAGTTISTSTTTGALQVAGGVGIGGSVYVGNRIGWTSATNVSAVYQYYNATTNSLDTVFG